MRTQAASALLLLCASCASPPASTQQDLIPDASTEHDAQSSAQAQQVGMQNEECATVQAVVRGVKETKNTTDCILVYLQDQRAQQQDPSLQNWTQPSLQDYELSDCRSRVLGVEDVNEAESQEVIGGR